MTDIELLKARAERAERELADQRELKADGKGVNVRVGISGVVTEVEGELVKTFGEPPSVLCEDVTVMFPSGDLHLQGDPVGTHQVGDLVSVTVVFERLQPAPPNRAESACGPGVSKE